MVGDRKLLVLIKILFLGKKVKVLSQDEIVPKKLKDYFKRHPEITKKLSKNKKTKILVTDITKSVAKLTQKWFGKDIKKMLVRSFIKKN